jgi:hypothetical protein
MSVLNQFMESSIAITEQIALTMQENERLKKRVTELEERKPEMELRDLRRMKQVVEAAIKNVELIEKSFGRSTEHLFGDEVNNLIKTVREYADNE